ncbi:hypothetical protein PsorP6_001123 [Peronosclerospora sorghi]|uniref:Uncharacterized protein n=1 Tax=Peronosclerospora sorghi TaxID=230839 RepID=A0ACC0WQX2_9STRA|nr:hypothetical protein PsorP6_001123 [Peronosclerospora sorghi]
MASNDVPSKKRRTLRDAEADLEACRNALHEARRRIVLTARENAKMKVLLMKYIEKDDSLVCSSQISGGEVTSSQPTSNVVESGQTLSRTDASALSQSSRECTTTEEGESEDSLWNHDFQPCNDGFTEPISQLSQLSHTSHWSELSSTSNLDSIINFLETHEIPDTKRYSSWVRKK